MGYNASGSGLVILKNEVPDDVLALLSSAEFLVEDTQNGGLWLTFEYDKYREDDLVVALKKLAPYVDDGEIDFHGDDNSQWKFEFENGRVYYCEGHIEYYRSEWDLYAEEE